MRLFERASHLRTLRLNRPATHIENVINRDSIGKPLNSFYVFRAGCQIVTEHIVNFSMIDMVFIGLLKSLAGIQDIYSDFH